MKRFRIRQEVSVTEENGAPIKEISVDMWVNTEGIGEDSVKDMFKAFSTGFTSLLEEMKFSEAKEEKVDYGVARWQ